MFDAVAKRYDVTNDVLSLGQDRRWRREVIKAVAPKPGELVLDLAAALALAPPAHGARLLVPLVGDAPVAGRARDGDALLVDQFALARPQHPRPESVGIGVGRLDPGAIVAGAAKHRLDPGEQLARATRRFRFCSILAGFRLDPITEAPNA